MRYKVPPAEHLAISCHRTILELCRIVPKEVSHANCQSWWLNCRTYSSSTKSPMRQVFRSRLVLQITRVCQGERIWAACPRVWVPRPNLTAVTDGFVLIWRITCCGSRSAPSRGQGRVGLDYRAHSTALLCAVSELPPAGSGRGVLLHRPVV